MIQGLTDTSSLFLQSNWHAHTHAEQQQHIAQNIYTLLLPIESRNVLILYFDFDCSLALPINRLHGATLRAHGLGDVHDAGQMYSRTSDHERVALGPSSSSSSRVWGLGRAAGFFARATRQGKSKGEALFSLRFCYYWCTAAVTVVSCILSYSWAASARKRPRLQYSMCYNTGLHCTACCGVLRCDSIVFCRRLLLLVGWYVCVSVCGASVCMFLFEG